MKFTCDSDDEYHISHSSIIHIAHVPECGEWQMVALRVIVYRQNALKRSMQEINLYFCSNLFCLFPSLSIFVGDSCVEKPLTTLWRNYTQNHKPDVVMRIQVCPSGLKATTRQHGLTEYWSNRITHCSSPKNYPRIFCWIYRHEGRKLKHELRCHAVLCPKETIAEQICKTLKVRLSHAVRQIAERF